MPASVEGDPEVPVPSSISASSIVVFEAEFVTVDPFTVKFPVTVKSFQHLSQLQ